MGENGQGKRTWELGVEAANGRGDFIGPPAWFTNLKPIQESQEGEGGVYTPGSLPAGPGSCLVAFLTILSFLVPAATLSRPLSLGVTGPELPGQALHCPLGFPYTPFTPLQRVLE